LTPRLPFCTGLHGRIGQSPTLLCNGHAALQQTVGTHQKGAAPPHGFAFFPPCPPRPRPHGLWVCWRRTRRARWPGHQRVQMPTTTAMPVLGRAIRRSVAAPVQRRQDRRIVRCGPTHASECSPSVLKIHVSPVRFRLCPLDLIDAPIFRGVCYYCGGSMRMV
jgi:hypothetical protein